MSIVTKHVTKRFGAITVLDDVSIDVRAGELVALLGPSGSGKTTLLRVIAGLDFPDSGTIEFSGADMSERTARDRRVGFVFQHYALFRHMTVFENIAFGLRVRPRQQRYAESAIRRRINEMLELIQLQNFASRYPSELSGGQRQRVALARALAVEPRVLLLDEPFGALDAKVRSELRRWLRQLHDEMHITSIFVTHDQEEALEVADRIAILNHGRIEQVGTPDHVYNDPVNPFVYGFLGNVNIFHGRADGAKTFVRPHALQVTRERSSPEHFRVQTTHIHAAGPLVKVEAITDAGAAVRIELTRDAFAALQLKTGERVFVYAKESRSFHEVS